MSEPPADLPTAPGRASGFAPAPAEVGLEQLMALIDHTSAVIYMRDMDGRYMLVNREYERLFDVRRKDIVGLTDHDLFPAHIADDFRANDLMAAAQGEPVQMEEVAPREDGLHSYITVKFPLANEAGQPYAVCGISTDITARAKAEAEVHRLNAELEQRVLERTAELEASTRELDAFAYSVSHDLRAPLRSLDGFSQLLIEDYDDVLDEDGRSYLSRIQVNAARMSQIIDDLLDLSRATRTPLRREPADLTAMAHEVVAELCLHDPARKVDVQIAEGLTTTGDTNLIRLVLLNLIGNAWKFTGHTPEARIEMDAVAEGGRRVFRIGDNGAGFDARYAAKLFDPFQRLHTTTEFDGSGIGLAIVHRIVIRHGGRISAEGAEGVGARFSFTLTPDPADLEER